MKQYGFYRRFMAVLVLACVLMGAVAFNGGICTASAASYETADVTLSAGSLEGGSIGTYYGQMKNGYAHGAGVIEYDFGGRFEGNFVEGFPEGYGKYYYEDGTSVSGTWSWGTTSGSLDDSRKGTSLSYEGMFCDDVVCGFGAMTLVKCGTFYGEFYDGNVDGWGIYAYASPMPESQPLMEGDDWEIVFGSNKYGHSYTGLTQNGFWQGFGIGVMDNGNYYVGEIRNEYRSGYGRLYVGGQVYQEGSFQDGSLVRSK